MIHVPLIIGHRGASTHAPENTLAAFRMAIDAGADGVEFDVQLSRDGVPVVIHDLTLERTGLRTNAVAVLTSQELSEAGVGKWFNLKFPSLADPAFESETVPTLAEVLDLLTDFEGLIYIELKYGEGDVVALAAAVCDAIRDSPLLPKMIVKSFRLAAIPEVRKRLPMVQTAALYEPKMTDFLRSRNHIVSIAREAGADQLSFHYSLVTRKLMSLADNFQMPVTVWTVNNPNWLARARRFGVRAVITNDPARLIAQPGRR